MPGVFAGTPDMSLAWPRFRPEPTRNPIPASPKQITPAAEQELRELLGQLPVGVYMTAHRLPPAVWSRFAELVPRGQLKSF